MTSFEFTGLHFLWTLSMTALLVLSILTTLPWLRYALIAFFIVFLVNTPIRFTIDTKPTQTQQDSITQELHKQLPPKVVVEEGSYEERMKKRAEKLRNSP